LSLSSWSHAIRHTVGLLWTSDINVLSWYVNILLHIRIPWEHDLCIL
jgi:hypothetical protein